MACFPAQEHEPPVRHGTTQLLTEHAADNDGNVLQADLLRVKVEFLPESRGHLDHDGDITVAEGDGVGTSGDEDAGESTHEQRFDEFNRSEGTRVDAFGDQVSENNIAVVFDGRGGFFAFFWGKIDGFFADDQVCNQLSEVDNGKNPENPLQPDMFCHETHDERSGRRANRSHERPPSQLLCAFFRLTQFSNNTATDADGRGDEDGSDDPGGHLTSVRGAPGTSDVADHASEYGEQADVISAIDGAERSPEEGANP